ncbi:hypothetical protein CDAR_381921 [Caerostris darwini]|uniref:Uncharacterized protein n=1 Tax=Caerostris darwini TaxID=1538125 RepID=A0AAV4V4Q9_9ARAC|nr:hypothetical protein CDAR_381921 [Caerostris darwini]
MGNSYPPHRIFNQVAFYQKQVLLATPQHKCGNFKCDIKLTAMYYLKIAGAASIPSHVVSLRSLFFLLVRFPLQMPPAVDCRRGWRGVGRKGLRERIPPQKSDPSRIGFTASQIPAPD